MKNVIIACDYAYVDGGAAKVAIQTAVALSHNSNLNVVFIGGSGEPCDELKNGRIKIIALRRPDLLGNKSKANAFVSGIYNKDVYCIIRGILSRYNANETVFHVHTWTKVLTSAAFKAANDLCIPIYVTIHDYFMICPNGGLYNFQENKICNIKPMSYNCVCCNCDSRNYMYKVWRCLRQKKQNRVMREMNNIRYIFISDFQKRQFIRRAPISNKIYMLKNMISIEDRHRVPAEKNKLYLFIGRVATEKGVELFCEAISKSGSEGVVIGDGQLLEKLKKDYPNITFTGWLNSDEVKKWILKARCLIFPSVIYECSPLTVPEVQAFGIPCITVNCNAAVDNVKNRVTGEVVKTSVESIINAIKRFQNDDYIRKLSEHTYDLFDEKRVSEEYYVNELLAIYGDK